MIATEKLYDKDPYRTEFEATVISCEPQGTEFAAILDGTCFFPAGGGQTADTGILEGIGVLDVQEKDGIIFHITSEALEPGAKVRGRVNFEERFSNMQQHSAEHILSGLIYREYGYENVGFHLSPQTVTMDIGGVLKTEQLEKLEREANRIVFENAEVEGRYPSEKELEAMNYRSKKVIEGPVRIVTIQGHDACACCAPHVKRTGEIGSIKIIRNENYKGGVRLSILAGGRAQEDTRKKQNLLDRIGQKFSTNAEGMEEALAHMQEEILKCKEKTVRLNTALIQRKGKELAFVSGDLFLFEEDLDSAVHRAYVNLLTGQREDICGIFTGTEGEYRYIIASRGKDVKVINKALIEVLGAKGGGSSRMVQGTIPASRRQIEDFLESR